MLSNKQYIKAYNSIIQLYQTFMCDLSSDVNNTPKTNTPRSSTKAKIGVGNNIEYEVKIYQVK